MANDLLVSETDELIPQERPLRATMAITPSVELENSANDAYVALIEEDSLHDHNDDNEDVRWLREQRILNKSLHWLKRPSVIMIATILFLLAFASSSAESTRQIITLKLACNYLGQDKCNKESAQVLMSNLQLGYSISSSIITLIASGKVAPLSDQYGRKVFVVLMLVCFFLGRTCKFMLMYNFTSLKFELMVACEILTNLCGGILALITLANCYISDVVEPHERIYSLGISIASLFLGLSIGPIVGNLLISISSKVSPTDVVNISKSDFLPLKFEVSILFLVLMVALFVLPESRSEKARRKSRTMSSSSSSSAISLEQQPVSWSSKLIDSINFLKPLKLLSIPIDIVPLQNRHRVKKDRIAVLILVFIDCMLASIATSFAEIYVLYGIYRYNWAQTDIGHLLAIGCSSRAIVLIFLSPIINHKIFQHGFGFKIFKKQFDMIDYSMTLLGLVCEVIGFIGYSLSTTTIRFFAFIVFCGFGSLISPALNSSIVKFYPESKIGELFGAMALLKNLFGLVMPICYLSIYKYSMRIQTPGLVFMIAATVLGICTVLLLVVKKVLGLDSKVRATVLKRSDSEVGSISVSFDGLNQASPKINELNRKSSFAQMERTGAFHN
ncbi:putative membrane protein [Spathaspora sp. JA1]|nr:putative membrane protein [Spathaspora sp. JA1]